MKIEIQDMLDTLIRSTYANLHCNHYTIEEIVEDEIVLVHIERLIYSHISDNYLY